MEINIQRTIFCITYSMIINVLTIPPDHWQVSQGLIINYIEQAISCIVSVALQLVTTLKQPLIGNIF